MKVNESLQADNYQKYLINFNNLKQEIKNELDKNILDSEMQDNIRNVLMKYYDNFLAKTKLIFLVADDKDFFGRKIEHLLMLIRELMNTPSCAPEIDGKFFYEISSESISANSTLCKAIKKFIDNNARSASSKSEDSGFAHQELTNIHSIKFTKA